MQWLELRFPPLLVLVAFAAAMVGGARLSPSLTAHFPGNIVLAAVLAAVGAIIALAGVVAFRKHATSVNPLTPDASSALVLTGVYRLSRNPMYLGFLIALLAGAVYLANAVAVLALPIFVGYMNRFQIKPEERALAAKFGPRYVQYLSAVRRWV